MACASRLGTVGRNSRPQKSKFVLNELFAEYDASDDVAEVRRSRFYFVEEEKEKEDVSEIKFTNKEIEQMPTKNGCQRTTRTNCATLLLRERKNAEYRENLYPYGQGIRRTIQ